MEIKKRVLRLFGGDPVSVGLDIGNHSVKIVYIKHGTKGPVLLGAGIHVFKEGTMESGEIKNRDELLHAITSLINKTDPAGKVKKVNFALSWSYGVIADRIRLKSSKLESDDELILMEAGRHSPFDVEDIQLDYKILDKNPVTGDMEVLLVAARLKVMQPFLSLIRDAGLDPVNIDVDTFAVANAFFFTASPEDKKKVLCLVNIGENVTNLTFIKHGAYHSTRDIPTAGSYFIQSLQKELQVEEWEAMAILKGRERGNYNDDTVQRCIEISVEELSIGLDLAFSYFQSSEDNLAIDKIIICGGGACIENLPDLLAERHETQVEIADPLGTMAYDRKKFVGAVPQDISTTLTVATGLALRRF
ncbi:type IV pilus assembly protein PilM [Fibrobacterota bacterium]